MKVSSCGLVFLAGATTVHGFVPHVMRTRVVRSFTGALASSAPVSRPYRPTADRCLLMGPKGDHLQHSTGGEERPTRQGRYPFGLHKVSGPGKLAAVGVLAAATTTQILPQAAVAAEAAIPIASAALDGSLVEMLTNSGFFQAFSLVFVSEIGDKTFFIAALLAAKTSRLISFVGSVGALAVMTVLAVLLGLAFHSVPTVFTSGLPLDDIIAAGAFLYFGINTLKDAYELPDNSNEGIEEEKAEAEESVKELKGKKTAWALILQTFSLVFAAEFGDRSFLTTIALGAAQNPVGVATGAIAAHASATGVAVTGGALLSQFISEKVVGYIGGSLFVVFALTTAIGIF